MIYAQRSRLCNCPSQVERGRQRSYQTVRTLIAEGSSIRAFDPAGMTRAAAELPEGPQMQYCLDAYSAAEGADALLILTEWKEFAALDLHRLRGTLAHPTVVDGRNLYQPWKMQQAGFTYISIGRLAVQATAKARQPRRSQTIVAQRRGIRALQEAAYVPQPMPHMVHVTA